MTEGAPKGPCPCGRPPALCVCPPAPPVDNRVAVLVLQHPQEQDRVLGTAKLLARSLADARVSVGLSWRNLGHAISGGTEQRTPDPRQWGVLYLGGGKAALGPVEEVLTAPVLSRLYGMTMPEQATVLAGLQGIVALDGNWAQAKALWWRNPWLTKLRRFVIVPAAPSLYGNLRKEARPDAVSTLEAVGFALAALEGGDVQERLTAPFRDLLAKARAAGVRGGVKRDRRVRR